MRASVSGVLGILLAATVTGGPVRAGTLPTDCTGVLDGTACDDGDPCTTGDACLAGVCVGDASGTCWTTRSTARLVVSASAYGHYARCTAKCESTDPGILILADDGTYRVPSGSLTECPSGGTTPLPDEVGTTRPTRRRGLVLEPANLDDLVLAAAECAGEANPFRKYGYHARLRFSRDGATFKGKATFRGRVPGRIPVRAKVVGRVTGADVTAGIDPPPPSRRPLPECTTTLELHCHAE
jgi:hypothetical protein